VKRKNKGSTLILVIIVLAVFSILSVSLLQVGLADAIHAIFEDNRIQASYIGRSGVSVGMKILDNKLFSNTYGTLDALITDLNNYVSGKSYPVKDTRNINNVGSFTLSYEKFNPGQIKIISKGIASRKPTTSSTTTFIINVTLAISTHSNPAEWINGINLSHSVSPATPNANYQGKGVVLENRPNQSPQGGHNPSTFRASIIYFRDHDGVSLRQIQNSVPITFDTEIAYFETEVDLNDTPTPVFLSLSSGTGSLLEYRATNTGALPLYPYQVGFEDRDRYEAFIGSYTVNYYDSYSSKFAAGSHYGVVYFGNDVVRKHNPHDTSPVTKVHAGYYFFRSGVNLQEVNLTNPEPDLISINPDDAIIKAIEALFKNSASRDGYLWNDR
jgi:hypothetical protein